MTQIAITEDVKQLIDSELSNGSYDSESDVVREAMHVLIQRRETIAGIQAGLDDFENGRFLSRDEFEASFRERFGIEDSTDSGEA